MTLLLDLGIIFGPVFGYVSQYKDISRARTAEGFSSLVSFILLSSNILRVFFWFGKRFELALLFQSIVMIVAQMVLVELICRFPTSMMRGHRFTDFNAIHFWSWEDFNSYVSFVGAFSAIVGFSTVMFGSFEWYIEFIGFAALLSEATLGIPQMLHNLRHRSTAGLSKTLIITWVAGDSFKTFYFVLNGAPFQFLLCGIIQLVVDAIIMFQFYAYSGSSSTDGSSANASLSLSLSSSSSSSSSGLSINAESSSDHAKC
eukprot:ANDGO_04550.mRNA.2 hypothetical protein